MGCVKNDHVTFGDVDVRNDEELVDDLPSGKFVLPDSYRENFQNAVAPTMGALEGINSAIKTNQQIIDSTKAFAYLMSRNGPCTFRRKS